MKSGITTCVKISCRDVLVMRALPYTTLHPSRRVRTGYAWGRLAVLERAGGVLHCEVILLDLRGVVLCSFPCDGV